MEIIIEQPITGEKTNISKLYNVVAAEGLTPVVATINTTANGVVDGTFYNSSFLTQRNIVLTIVPDGDIEEKRLELYRIFRPKSQIRVHVKSRFRNVYIDSRVESVETDLYAIRQSLVISLIAPQPFFLDAKETTQQQSATVDAFELPFEIPEKGLKFGDLTKDRDIEIENDGEEASGLVIEIVAIDRAINPVIYNKTTREKYGIKIELQKGDKVEINTHKGQKEINLSRGGTTQNILNKIEKETRWLTVEVGKNIFSYTCEGGEENVKVSYRFNGMYGGI